MTTKELNEACHTCLKTIQAAAGKDYNTQWNMLLTICQHLTKECIANGYTPQPGNSVFSNLYVQRMALHYIAKEYPGRTIENIIQNIESRIKEQDKL